MLRFVNYDIVFQEIPGEVTLAINLSGCLYRCKKCHSPYLWGNTGKLLDEYVLTELLKKYENSITCICFMGGDAYPKKVADLAIFFKKKTNNSIKIGWYSGRSTLFDTLFLQYFDYIKLGSYVENFGGLDSITTNQHFYYIENGKMIDATSSFKK